MPEQVKTLWDVSKSRRADTSRQAYRGVKHNLGELHERILEHIRACPGLTSREIATDLGLCPWSVSGRITELKIMGNVYWGARRRCTVGGRSSHPCYSVEADNGH